MDYVANLVNSTILTNICYNISRFIRGVIMTREELEKYPFELSKLSEEDGGGYLISYTDFNECISDGETIEEALKNGYEALIDCIESMKAWNMPIPEPFSYLKNESKQNGKIALRLSKSLHTELAMRAKEEDVSMNFLAALLIAEGLGARKHI
jgi:antitoxin HicB